MSDLLIFFNFIVVNINSSHDRCTNVCNLLLRRGFGGNLFSSSVFMYAEKSINLDYSQKFPTWPEIT